MKIGKTASGEVFLHVVLLMLIGFAVYFPALNYPFFLDDDRLVGRALSGESVWSTLTGDYFQHYGVQGKGGFYRPVASLTFFVDARLWGDNPAGFHLTNILLHCGVGVAVYFLVRKFFRAEPRRNMISFVAGVIFTLFARHAEPVVWIAARTDLLAALFTVISVLFYLKWLEEDRWSFIFGAVISGFLALLSKESSLILPMLWLIVHFRTRQREKVVVGLAASGALLLTILLARWNALGSFVGGEAAMAGFDLSVPRVLQNVVKGILALLIPAGFFDIEFFGPWQRCFYVLGGSKEYIVLGSVLVIALVAIVLVILFSEHRRDMLWSLSLVLVSIAPALSRRFPLFDAADERLLYLPTVFFTLVVIVIYLSLRPRKGASTSFLIFVLSTNLAFLYVSLGNWGAVSAARRTLESSLRTIAITNEARYLVVLDRPFVKAADPIGIARDVLFRIPDRSLAMDPERVLAGISWDTGREVGERHILWRREGNKIVGIMSDSSLSFLGYSVLRDGERFLYLFEETGVVQPIVKVYGTLCDYFHARVELEFPNEVLENALFVSSYKGRYRAIALEDQLIVHPSN